jgi:hypothetical protein
MYFSLVEVHMKLHSTLGVSPSLVSRSEDYLRIACHLIPVTQSGPNDASNFSFLENAYLRSS